MNFYYRFCLGFLALSFLVSNAFADEVDTIDQNNRWRMSSYNSSINKKITGTNNNRFFNAV